MWKNFLKQADLFFWGLFLLAIPFSIRKVFPLALVRGQFNEYTSAPIYLSDILLGVTFAIWGLIILYNKIANKSRCRLFELKKDFWQSPVFWLGLFIIWNWLSIFWSNNHSVAIFRSIKITEWALLFIYIKYRVINCSTWNISSLAILLVIISGVFQSILAIFQFILQHSVGLFWLKESLISPDISGVAKIIFANHILIRAYGTLPHPNILGGFLVFSIISTLLYIKLFHHTKGRANACLAEDGESRRVEQFRDWKKLFHVEQFARVSLVIQIFGLFLTFSKSAIIGLLLGLVYLYWEKIRKMFHRAKGRAGVEHSLLISKLFHVEHFVIIVIILLAILLILFKLDWFSFVEKSFIERGFYTETSLNMIGINVPPSFAELRTGKRGTIIDHPCIGLGNGQFILNIEQYSPVNPQDWQFQPVHNVWLLIFSELGLIGLGLFLGFIFGIIKNCSTTPKGGQAWNNLLIRRYVMGFLIAIFFISMFDHYLWDIQAGIIIFWLMLALV